MTLEQALENFITSPEFRQSIIDSTKAGWSGSSYKVELFEDGTFKVLWANMIGNLYETPGHIMTIPSLADENYSSRSTDLEADLVEAAFFEEDEIAQSMRNELRDYRLMVEANS
jgi:hypothetical protein